MRRFFVAPEAVQGDTVYFDAQLSHHMGTVLRLSVGEQVTVCAGEGLVYVVELEQFTKDAVQGRIVEQLEQQQDTNVQLVLYQGMPKGDKLELIIQKCTELGISEIIPVETSRSIVHLDSGKAAKKLERWQKIAQEASQQSKRIQVPTVNKYFTWKQCVAQLAQDEGLTLVLWEDEHTQSMKGFLRSLPQPPQKINLVIGPEGGLSEEEVLELREGGAVTVSLGKRILRTETAGMAALAMLNYEYECE